MIALTIEGCNARLPDLVVLLNQGTLGTELFCGEKSSTLILCTVGSGIANSTFKLIGCCWLEYSVYENVELRLQHGVKDN